MLLQPEPGFGLDARLPMGKHVRCCLALEAYIHGGSAIYFGLEPARFPFIYMQFVPSTRLTLRLPILPLTEFKSMFAGGSLTLYKEGARPRPVWNGWKALWKSLEQFVAPVVEVQHRNTLLGAVLDAEQRSVLRAALEEVNAKREERMRQKSRKRGDIVKRFDPPEMPSLDPRKRPDAIDGLREKMRERYGDQGIVRGNAMDMFWEQTQKRYGSDGIAKRKQRLIEIPKENETGSRNESGFCRPPGVLKWSVASRRLSHFGRRW